MKVTLAMVASLDGRTTDSKQAGPAAWASPEDQAEFRAQIAAHDCVVMGSSTYEASRAIIKPRADKPRIVLTRQPQKFAEERRPGLTFSSDTPEAIILDAQENGCRSLLLVGGAETNARFFDVNLIDEVLVTIEPTLFGAGTAFTNTLKQKIQLQLKSCKQLNTQGTLLVHYLVQKPKQGNL
jgi:dihydrofolate reductase